MAFYEFYCYECREASTHEFPMSAIPDDRSCDVCGKRSPRVFSLPNFQEDRCRLARNPLDGSTRSAMLGQEYPQSRTERDRIYREKEIEPVSKRDMPAEWKTAIDYSKHVASGGERLDPKTFEPPRVPVKSIVERMRESNMRIPG